MFPTHNKYKIMVKYIVRGNAFTSNNYGIRNSEDFEFVFKETNPMDARKKGIKKLKKRVFFQLSAETFQNFIF